MNLIQAAAVVLLWRSGRFDTFDIASVLRLPEPDICKIIHAANEHERGPDLRVVS
jgi:hypothetical protein